MRLSEQVMQLEENEQSIRLTAINLKNTIDNLRKEKDKLRLENDQIKTCVPRGCYDAIVSDCNNYISEISILKAQVRAINTINETLQKRYSEKIKQVETLEDANTQLQAKLGKSACRYSFNEKTEIAEVNKSNGEVAKLMLCKGSPLSSTSYMVLEVPGTERFVCLRKEEWDQLVKKYLKEYLL